jgi:hypothetical protein
MITSAWIYLIFGFVFAFLLTASIHTEGLYRVPAIDVVAYVLLWPGFAAEIIKHWAAKWNGKDGDR